MTYTFSGGIHIKGMKSTAKMKAVEFLDVPSVAIPMSQHIGAPCKVLVSVGDHVDIGQCIGDGTGLCAPVHASVSGKVLAIERRQLSSGAMVEHVVIENDGQNSVCADIKGVDKPLTELGFDEIVEKVRAAGIVGMGGAAFPAHKKLRSAKGKAKRLIINCAECEPYITANHRLMLEEPEAIIKGTKILIHALGLRGAVIAIEQNKANAARALQSKINDKRLIGIKMLETKYPQGDERQIIYALYGKEVPAGKLPTDVGFVLFNAETVANIYRALSSGMPSVYKRVTVDGNCIKKPCNLIVPVGTSFSDIAEHCGGTKKKFARLIVGGPMMGQAQWSLDSSVTKSTGALLFLSAGDEKSGNCIRCGRCMQVCQMRLVPALLAANSRKGLYENCASLGALNCVECGCCTYICPGKVPIVQYIRDAKSAIREASARLKKASAPKEEKAAESFTTVEEAAVEETKAEAVAEQPMEEASLFSLETISEETKGADDTK